MVFCRPSGRLTEVACVCVRLHLPPREHPPECCPPQGGAKKPCRESCMYVHY